MRTFSRYLLESPIDELPPTIKGEHPHKILDTYREEMESAIRDENWPPQADIGFTSRSIYYDPDREVTSNISMDHATPGWAERKDGNHGVAHVVVSVSGKTNDKSKSKFHMPGEVMGIIDTSRRHLHHFIGENTPRGLHTIEYETKDPKRHALYQHMARLYPHITFKNISKLKSVKRKPKPVAIPESYTQKQMATANQTSRNSGAIGKKAITPAYVKTITGKKHKILDFGSGRDAAHTKALRKSGRNVTAHEFGANVNQNHDPKALDKKFDVAMVSNVFNTASSRKMLRNTLDQVTSTIAPGGSLVGNLPLSPRKSVKVDAKHLMGQLMKRFGDVRRVGGTKKAPLFHATGPK